MIHYSQVYPDEETSKQRDARLYHENYQGAMTNMKRTLLQDVASFKVYMGWYDLKAGLVTFLSEREFSLFSYAISTTNDCLVCSLFFRRILIDSGDDPDNLQLSSREQLLWDFGQAIVTDFHQIKEEIYARLTQEFSETQGIQLMAFAGQMIATNVFVSIANVELDEVLYAYQKEKTDESGI